MTCSSLEEEEEGYVPYYAEEHGVDTFAVSTTTTTNDDDDHGVLGSTKLQKEERADAAKEMSRESQHKQRRSDSQYSSLGSLTDSELSLSCESDSLRRQEEEATRDYGDDELFNRDPVALLTSC